MNKLKQIKIKYEEESCGHIKLLTENDYIWIIEQCERAEIYKNALMEIGSNKYISKESGIANAALIKADSTYYN